MATPALTHDDFDTAVRPQDDLYRHVNGQWLATAVIDDDKHSAGSFIDLRDASERAVNEIITGLDPADHALDTEKGKIAALYATFMDTEVAEIKGAEPLLPLLARVEAISSVGDLVRHWGWALRHGLGRIAGFDIDADPGNPKRYIMFAGQSGLGLPDEEYYRDDQYAEIRDKYLDHVERSLTLAGLSDAAAQARRVFELETAIAALHWDKVETRDLRKMYNPRTWAEFTELSPLPWDEFLAGAELPASTVADVVVAQPSFFESLPDLVTENHLESWKSWARWKIVAGLSSFLSSEFVNARFDFYDKTLMGVPELRERWKRGVQLVEGAMGEGVGKIYVERHFPDEAKQRMDELVANLLKAYGTSIEKLEWMTEATRAQALDKLSKFRPKIGFPAKWRDYSALQVLPGDLVGSVLESNSFDLDHLIEKIVEPVDPDEWFMFPQTVNAYYHPLRNEIVFPAAILQPPFFNVDADDAVNYGGIGAVIGHEIGHGFDDQGSTCDGDGVLRDWWTQADREAFDDRTRVLVSQFDALAPQQLPDVHVNGALTIGENIGDLGGVGIAYQAWRLATAGNDPEPIDNLTGAQRFFLGYAAIWQNKMRDDAMKQRIAVDPHSPAEFRCNQIVRNVDAFYEAFEVGENDALWLAADERVSIW